MDHNLYYYKSQYIHNENDENQSNSENENENVYEIENQNEKDGDALLISLVRDYPYLYNKELTDFKDNIKKQNAWIEIGNIMNMTANECQSRWTRLRERYTREKKLKQGETTTGSGASKRRTFEFFEDMQFLEPFVKKRRTMTNVHIKSQTSQSAKCFNLQKNFSSRVYSGKENNFSSAITSTLVQQPSKNSNVVSEQNLFKAGSNGEKQINVSSANTAILVEQSLMDDTDPAYLKDSTSDFLNESDTSSTVLSTCDMRNKSSIGQRMNKSKGKAQSDVLQNTICKVASLLENKYSSTVSSSSLKQEVEEDVAFCQLILSLLKKMPQPKNIQTKKEILRIIYNIE